MHTLFLIFSFIVFILAIIQSKYLFTSTDKIELAIGEYRKLFVSDELETNVIKSLNLKSLFSLIIGLIYIVCCLILTSISWYTYFGGILAMLNLGRHFYVKEIFKSPFKKSVAISILHPLNVVFSLVYILAYFF